MSYEVLAYSPLLSLAVDCGALADPMDGTASLSGTTFGQTALYQCALGYNIVGGSSRTCQENKQWSGTAPTCRSMCLCVCVCVYFVYVYYMCVWVECYCLHLQLGIYIIIILFIYTYICGR